MTGLRVADEPVGTLAGGRVEQADGVVGGQPIVTHAATRSARRLGSPRVRPATMVMRQRLRQVLAGQSFPAERWELSAAAEMYGADLVTPNELALQPLRYEGLADVLLALAVEHTRRACRWLEQ